MVDRNLGLRPGPARGQIRYQQPRKCTRAMEANNMVTVAANSELQLKAQYPGVYCVQKRGPLLWSGLLDDQKPTQKPEKK